MKEGITMRNNDSKNHESEITIVDENVAINCMPKILETLDLAKNDKILVEASPYDAIWGIKVHINDVNAYDIDKWQGLNLLGFALTEVRDELTKTVG